jgi:putative transcriptional regulator
MRFKTIHSNLSLGILLTFLSLPIPVSAQSSDEIILLVATTQLEGSFFEQSVILVAPQASGAAVGVMLNRPITVDEIQIYPEDELLSELDGLHLGGPVNTGVLLYLFRSENSPEAAIHLFDDVYFSNSRELLSQQLKRPRQESHLKFYVGYAGWAVGQLQDEILRGSWKTLQATPKLIFESDPASIWFELTRKTRDDWI